MSMVKIFLETATDKTPEYYFYKTFLRHLGISDDKFELICVGGKDNLFKNKNIMEINTLEGGTNLVIFDADTEGNRGGYTKRYEEIMNNPIAKDLSFDLFLMPDNGEDGDFETMIEAIARKDLNSPFFSCYESYERCVERHKDSDGNQMYYAPNRKGKLHTYITSMRMSKTLLNKVKGGDWLFDNSKYWDIDSTILEPLKVFLLKNFDESSD